MEPGGERRTRSRTGHPEDDRNDNFQRRKHVLVIGGGVSGLTSAWKLLEAGYEVTVVAKDYAPATPRIVSQVAGALWEWPPAVCGNHSDNKDSLERSKKWCMVSYNHFARMAADPELSNATGVRMRKANFFFEKPISEYPEIIRKVQELKESGVRGVRHDSSIINEELGWNSIHEDAFQHLAPVIDTDTYMVWLRNYVIKLGAELLYGEVKSCVRDIEEELLKQYHADAIINCTGLGATLTARDASLQPLRGCLVRVKNGVRKDGSRMQKVESCFCVPHIDSNGTDPSDDMVFIVPRNEDVIVLGGSVEPDEWDVDLNLDNSPVVRRILDRCCEFLPVLKDAELDHDYPVAVGLRPFRTGNVLLEAECGVFKTESAQLTSRIVHNYGHGGSGFTLSHGCAEEVVRIVNRMLQRDVSKFSFESWTDYTLDQVLVQHSNILEAMRLSDNSIGVRAVKKILHWLSSLHLFCAPVSDGKLETDYDDSES